MCVGCGCEGNVMFDSKNYVFFDASYLDQLPPEAIEPVSKSVCAGAYIVSSEFDLDPCQFAFDETSVVLIERYLREHLCKRVDKWGKGQERYQVKRVVIEFGVKSSSQRQIAVVDNTIHVIGLLYTYCCARAVAGKVIVDNETICLDSPAGKSFTLGKVRKFMRNGQEDSPVAFLGVIKHMLVSNAERDKMIDMLKQTCAASGKQLPDNYKIQVWYDEDDTSVIDRVVFLDEHQNEIASVLARLASDQTISVATGKPV